MNRFLITCFLFVGALACKHKIPTANNNPSTNPNTTTNNKVCFEKQILPLLQTNCAKSGCHDAISSKKGIVLDSYTNIMKEGVQPFNLSESDLYEAITENDPDKIMPPPPSNKLSSDQINLISKWIMEGAQNTTGCNVCDETIFTYSGTVSKIMNNNCVGCHGNTSPSAGINLSSYDGVATIAGNGKLVGTIKHSTGYSPMPKNGNKLSDCDITVIQKWINAGFPNN